MKAGSQSRVSQKNNRTSLIRLGLFGFAIASVLIYNQTSFNSHSRAYDQALSKAAEWENRLSDVLTIKGNINGIVESVSQIDGDSPDSFRPIEQAMSDLQAAWVQHGASIPGVLKTRVGMDIDLISLASMKTADELRGKDLGEARRQALSVVRLTARVSPILTELEGKIERNRLESETERQSALASMSRRQSIEVSAFFVLGVAFVGFLAVSLANFAGRVSRQPQAPVARAMTHSRGFSLIETLMVVAITLTLSTIAIANIAAVVSNSRIRAGISSMSGLLQNCRMMAVKKNKTMTAHVTVQPNGSLMGYVKDATDSSQLAATDSQVKWEAPVVRLSTPSGPGSPDLISTTVLGYTPQTADISFNSRGLPCVYASGVCTNYGFLYYFKDTSRTGPKGWAALSISPAGKIKKWFWNNSSWNE